MSRPIARDRSVVDVHVCPSCACTMVQPLDWQRADAWQIALRCPECEWSGCGIFTAEAAAAFDEESERATDQLLTDLQTFARANFEADIERFVAALRDDLIFPEDF